MQGVLTRRIEQRTQKQRRKGGRRVGREMPVPAELPLRARQSSRSTRTAGTRNVCSRFFFLLRLRWLLRRQRACVRVNRREVNPHNGPQDTLRVARSPEPVALREGTGGGENREDNKAWDGVRVCLCASLEVVREAGRAAQDVRRSAARLATTDPADDALQQPSTCLLREEGRRQARRKRKESSENAKTASAGEGAGEKLAGQHEELRVTEPGRDEESGKTERGDGEVAHLSMREAGAHLHTRTHTRGRHKHTGADEEEDEGDGRGNGRRQYHTHTRAERERPQR